MNECCEIQGNRREGFGPRGPFNEERLAEGVTVTHCVVCESRHVEAAIDPMAVGAEGSAL